MITLKVQNLHKSFNGHPVLKDISFSAKQGEVLALLGRSGSGKSTMLRCINLLTMPDQGKLQVNNAIMDFDNDQNPTLSSHTVVTLRKEVGMVFQQFNLWAHMTVLDNLIQAPIHVLKQNKKQTIREAIDLLNKVGLVNKRNAYPVQLSGGEQQRAAIARSLMMKPDIMLFDEPTSALDPEMIGEVLEVMQQLAKEGMTMLIATHEIRFAKCIANHTIFLENGNIIEQGSTHTMFSKPKTERFRRFLKALHHDIVSTRKATTNQNNGSDDYE